MWEISYTPRRNVRRMGIKPKNEVEEGGSYSQFRWTKSDDALKGTHTTDDPWLNMTNGPHKFRSTDCAGIFKSES